MRALLLSVLLASSASAMPAATPNLTLTDIGVAAAVRGAVKAVAPGQDKAVGRVVSSGKPLYLNDSVKTGKGGRLQIMLLDETTFTIGQDAEMLLDEFVYDPATNKGKVSAKMVKGAFRFVTGRIARREVGDMKVRLPAGTIGIRGTIVDGVVHENGDADVALGGPGQDNNAGESPGGITVSNDAGSVDIDRSGYMTSIRGGGAPTLPVRVSDSFKTETNIVGLPANDEEQASGGGSGDNEVAASESNQDGGGQEGQDGQSGGGSAADTSGDSAAQGGSNATVLFEETATGQNETVEFAAQQNTTTNGASGLADGPSRWEDVLLLTGGGGQAGYSGSGSYSCGSGGGEVCSTPGSGTMTFELFVDFTNRTVGGSGSNINLTNGPLSGTSTNINTVSYGGQTSGNASLSLTSALANSNFDSASVQLNNKDGVAAKEATMSFGISFENASGSATGALGTLPAR